MMPGPRVAGAALLASLLVLVAGVAQAPAVERVFDYLPRVTYLGEPVVIAVRDPAAPAQAWEARAEDGASVPMARSADGSWQVVFIPNEHPVVTVQQPGGVAAQTIRVARPGDPMPLRIAADGRLMSGDDIVILGVARRERTEDRRWAWLRSDPTNRRYTCEVHLTVPDVPHGASPLLRQLVDARSATITNQHVLLSLGAGDCFAAWRHRSYRQLLAWVVEDLRARGASQVVVAPPVSNPAERSRIQPLVRQVRDIADTYHLAQVDVSDVFDAAYWTLETGVLSDRLNADGQAAYREALGEFLSP